MGGNVMNRTIVMGAALALVAATPFAAMAQEAMATPAATPAERPGAVMTPMPAGVQALKGQTGEQAQLDVAQCQTSSSQATGYVPGAPSAVTAPTPTPKGGRAKGAAVGAAAGATAGAVQNSQHPYAPPGVKDDHVGNQAAAGAAAGAVAGGMNQRQDRRKASATQKQAEAAEAQKAAAWKTAYGTCLQGRGYALQP